MADRYRYPPLAGRPPSAFNPARVSLASNLPNYGPASPAGYSPAVDPDFVSSPQRYTSIPRGYHPAAGSGAGSPAPSARSLYPMNPEPRPPSRPGNREPSRNRRSTLDAVPRPPIIVTTMQDHHPHNAASHSSAAAHAANPSAHSASPVRDAPYRSSDGKLYAQPASSIRSRSTNRPYHAYSASEDYARPRERGEMALAPRDADNYRSSRPSVHYPSDPRHSNAAIDYGDDGYQYTNAGELVKYDLDHAVPPPSSRSRRRERHESFDRGYSRPNVNYNADQRSFNVGTGHELSRHYSTSSRPYDTRGGPPPSTRGFEKINRAIESLPPVSPMVPVPSSPSSLDGSSGTLVRRDPRRPRPVSLTQEMGSRGAHVDEYYRGHVPDDGYDHSRYYDDGIPARGGGSRMSPPNGHDERSSRYWEPKRNDSREDFDRESIHPREDHRKEKPRLGSQKGSDDHDNGDDACGPDAERDEVHRASHKEEPRDRSETRERSDARDTPEPRRLSDGEHEIRPMPSFRDKISAGFGMAASAVGLGSSAKRDDKKPRLSEDREPSRRHSLDDDDAQDRHKEAESRGRSPVEGEREVESQRNGDMGRKSEADIRERHRREAEARLNGEAVFSGSESDGSKRAPSVTPSVRRRASSLSNIHVSSSGDLKQLKEQAAAESEDKEDKEDEEAAAVEPRGREASHSPERARSVSPAETDRDLIDETPLEENRGRDLVVLSDIRQVRVVSPPREKKEGKPLKGILKQPKASFPEERNPIREGVAPHKDDKKLKEVPAGAKWTKINRRLVNPEALEVGKERYEVRDDFVIVLRVLSREEIQTYTKATQVLRERRRNKEAGDRERDRERDYDRSYNDYDEQYDEGRAHRDAAAAAAASSSPAAHHHHRRQRTDEGALREDWGEDRERERRRRGRREEDEYAPRTREAEHRHHRPHRDRA
ncbi:hypothetical protein ESCO_002370 [Escovopsis weberi]|uniref:DUF8035 domain-containing protein n=1 Tax=Escovopsis weberi TaxID=150374 RepID=A0A0M8MZL8_ESCWE|nr:hypothetical protein ESCO_002370 [Escovopsis weberi]